MKSGAIQRFVQYRPSVALAACGVLIASVLIAVGPGIAGDGGAPARSVAWIVLGLFVAVVWGAAAVLAARRIEAMEAPPARASTTSSSSTRGTAVDARNIDFAPLFSEFLDMRSRCRDVGDVPSFEEFTQSLQRQRAAMMATSRSHAVSFYVAFVDGHAVVRARTAE